jgi:hypothetical protein
MNRTVSHNEHDFDCCDFFAIAAPHRWRTIQDFMQDRNGTVTFQLPVSPDAQCCVGTYGVPPDQHLMLREDCGFDLEPYISQFGPYPDIAVHRAAFHSLTVTAQIESRREHNQHIREMQKRKSNP